MSLLLYGIIEGKAADGVGAGIAERPLRTVARDGLVALVTEHEDCPALTEATVWEFEQVIETQMADRAVIPARFGTVVEDAASLESLLHDRREELRATFERIRGAVELGVRATWPSAETQGRPHGPDAGTAYMLARVTQNRLGRELADRMDLELGGLARAAHYRVLSRPTDPVIAAYLVDSDRTDEFVAGVRDLGTAIEDAELVCTGPWPPYSFVGARSDD